MSVRVKGSGCRVWGSGFRALRFWGLECRVGGSGLGFEAQDLLPLPRRVWEGHSERRILRLEKFENPNCKFVWA